MTDFNTSNNIHEKIIDANNGMIFPTFVIVTPILCFHITEKKNLLIELMDSLMRRFTKRGGGILNSAKKLQKTSKETLYKQALKK